MNSAPVFIAITDAALRTECQHIVAAAGYQSMESTDPRQMTLHAHRAAALLVDACTATHAQSLQTQARIFFISPDTVAPDWQLALQCHAEAAWRLPSQSAELLTALTTPATLPASGRLIAVCGAAGGVGTSTFAACLAALACDHSDIPVVLVDIDPGSGGLDLLLGVEEQPGVRWNDIGTDTASLSGAELIAALPHTSSGLAVLTSHREEPMRRDSEQIQQVLSALRTVAWVFLDIPRQQGSELLPGSDAIIVIIPAEIRAAAAVVPLLAGLRLQHTSLLAVLRHRGWSGMAATELADVLGMEITAEIFQLQRLAKAIEIAGLPRRLPKQMRRAAHAVLQQVGCYE